MNVNTVFALDVDGQVTVVEQNVRKMARIVDDLADDDDLGKVSTLRSMVSTARKSAVTLARIGAGDSRAEKLVREYDESLNAFASSISDLADLKELQFSADGGKKSCQDVEKKLYQEVDKLVREGVSENIEKIELLARSYQRQTIDLMSHYERTLKIADSEKRDVEKFNKSDGPWKSVLDSVKKAGDKMYRHLARQITESKKACETIKRGDKNPKIKKAVSDLEKKSGAGKSSSKNTMTEDELRKEIRDIDAELISQLKEIAGLIEDVKGETNTRSIDRAIGNLKPLGKTILRLKPVVNFKTDDRATKSELKKASGQLKEYPRALTNLGKSLTLFKAMKIKQFDLDEKDEYCEDTEKEFNEDIESWVKQGGDEALEEIDEDAEDLVNEISSLIKDSTGFLSDFDKLTRQAKLFAFRKGAWNSVEKNVDKTADMMKDYVESAHADLTKSCEHLLDPYDLVTVEDAISQLKDFQEQVDEFKIHSENWFQNTRNVFSLSCSTLNNVRDLACASDIDSANDPDIARIEREISAITSGTLQEIKKVIPEYKKLRSTGNAILKQEEEKEVGRLLTNMEKKIVSLQNTIKSGQLKGTRNPFVQMAVKYGIAHHKSMENESRFDCVIRDVAIPNLRVRPDCISVKNCTVYEFKPNNPKQVAEGEKQAASYAKEVIKVTNNMLSERYKRSMIPNLAQAGSLEQKQEATEDNAYLDALWDHHCITNEGDVLFDSKVETYDKCKDELKLECPVE